MRAFRTALRPTKPHQSWTCRIFNLNLSYRYIREIHGPTAVSSWVAWSLLLSTSCRGGEFTQPWNHTFCPTLRYLGIAHAPCVNESPIIGLIQDQNSYKHRARKARATVTVGGRGGWGRGGGPYCYGTRPRAAWGEGWAACLRNVTRPWRALSFPIYYEREFASSLSWPSKSQDLNEVRHGENILRERVQYTAERWRLGCLNSPPRPEEARLRDHKALYSPFRWVLYNRKM